jgi:hypothetical protein
MNLPDAPIAHDGFFATHFFTMRDQEKSKDFYVRILGGKVIKPENPCDVYCFQFTEWTNWWQGAQRGDEIFLRVISEKTQAAHMIYWQVRPASTILASRAIMLMT